MFNICVNVPLGVFLNVCLHAAWCVVVELAFNFMAWAMTWWPAVACLMAMGAWMGDIAHAISVGRAGNR